MEKILSNVFSYDNGFQTNVLLRSVFIYTHREWGIQHMPISLYQKLL